MPGDPLKGRAVLVEDGRDWTLQLTGNLDQRGGDFIPQPVPVRDIQLRERLPAGVQPITSAYPLFDTFNPIWGSHAQSCLVDSILDGKPYPIRTLIVQSGNPAVTMTDSSRVRRALEQVEFLVVMDPFMTETAKFADVVLPACLCFEKTQLNRAFMRNNLVILQNQVLDWLGDSWPDWKITFELARRLGLEKDFPWQSAEEAIDYQLEPSGITVAMLRGSPAGIQAAEAAFQKYLDRGFATPSGKVEIYSERLRRNGHQPVPYSDGWTGDPISFSGRCEEFPMIGISGSRPNRFTHSQFHHVPALLAKEPEALVDIHPLDARSQNLSNGDWATLETPKGHVRMKARISDMVHPGSIRIAWGWGDVNPDANLNNLTDDEKRNPVTGTPSNRSFMCRIQAVRGAGADG